MDVLLDALQDGRLIEFPENTKERALQILGSLIEGVPSLPRGTDVVGAALARERSANTAIGGGWACPHARLPFEGDMVCAIGWSPTGIDYGAPDGLPVRIVTMYLIPENQKTVYLKEISTLAKALKEHAGLCNLETATDLNDVRNRLLDLVSAARSLEWPDARARMIRLEARQPAVAMPAFALAGVSIQAVTIIVSPGVKPVVLAQHADLVRCLEAAPNLAEALARQGMAEAGGWRVLSRAAATYQLERVVYDCLAIHALEPAPKSP
jgi:nitrogen PTS system EIIA component